MAFELLSNTTRSRVTKKEGRPPFRRNGAGMSTLRAAFYSHDTFGLGHLMRCLKVASALTDRLGPMRGLMITGSPWAHLFAPPDGFSYLQLPPVVKSGPDDYRPRDPATPMDRLIGARSGRILEALDALRPDLFMVDNVPCGLAREIVPALSALKARRGARLVLALRDVLDRDDLVRRQWSDSGAFEMLEGIYDEIWVFGPRDAPVAGFLPGSVAHKVVYCGYLGGMRSSSRRDPIGASCAAPWFPDHKPGILVTGGGGGDSALLVETYLEALRTFRPAVSSLVVLGPDFPEPPALSDVSPGDLAIVRFLPDLPGAMEESDVVVSMAGYHTVCEVLAAGRPSILVPRVWPRREQWLRAAGLRSSGRARVIEPGDLTPHALWRAIEAALSEPAPAVQRMTGGEMAAGRAAALLGLAIREGA